MKLAATQAFVLILIVIFQLATSKTNGNSSFHSRSSSDEINSNNKTNNNDDNRIKLTLLTTNDIFRSNNEQQQQQQSLDAHSDRNQADHNQAEQAFSLESGFGGPLGGSSRAGASQAGPGSPDRVATSLAIRDLGSKHARYYGDAKARAEFTQGLLESGAKRSLNPVILIPGDGGSRIQAKLDRQKATHVYCERKSNDWFDLWLNLSLLVPFALDCWVENMKMVYNSTTRRTSSPPGVITRVHGFGRSDAVEFVDSAKVSGTSYFEAIVKQLIELGYERDKNILGAPYDFRRAPNELQDYFKDLKDLVEIAYNENDQQRVVIICHSMGCLNSLYFLNSKAQNWKDKYIKSLVTLAGAWGGSVKAMKAFASGDNFGVVVIPALSLRKDIRTFPSLAYLLPSDQIWPRDMVLLKNKNNNYTVDDYKQFFDDIKYPIGYEMWKDVRNLTSPRQPPGVEVHCLHGHKVTTMERLEYLSGEFPDTARLKQGHGDGDGTVNAISLEACSQWRAKQRHPIHHEKFANIDHMAILSDRKVMEYLIESFIKK